MRLDENEEVAQALDLQPWSNKRIGGPKRSELRLDGGAVVRVWKQANAKASRKQSAPAFKQAIEALGPKS